MQILLQTTLSSLLIGTMIVINGVSINPNKIMSDTKDVVNATNLHQIATVLEIYYINHDRYPQVSNGRELMDVFENEGYILNRPMDPNIFNYQAISDAQDYKLSINK
jgi:hypothetical protein